MHAQPLVRPAAYEHVADVEKGAGGGSHHWHFPGRWVTIGAHKNQERADDDNSCAALQDPLPPLLTPAPALPRPTQVGCARPLRFSAEMEHAAQQQQAATPSAGSACHGRGGLCSSRLCAVDRDTITLEASLHATATFCLPHALQLSPLLCLRWPSP